MAVNPVHSGQHPYCNHHFCQECMKYNELDTCVDSVFQQITGIAAPEGFGRPFERAFSMFHSGNRQETKAAAYICSLFLSAILEGYPTARLHTFVHHIEESIQRFSFNCNMYESIFKEMDSKELTAMSLIQADNRPTTRKCSKEDIFEAFDFYTNR